ncbi:hypothetical protein [Nocardia barduliensis]|uniref:hypothetical protein n=1 Tax=Nocardia barduliensis TaxID=2736643 RepID=UPI0015724D24|nr:hypothetical protein [Nocardia barduliensis]
MSESKGAGHRSRRRAVRSAGPPPVEENATDPNARVAVVDDAKVAVADGAKIAAADEAKSPTADEVKAAASGGAKVAAADEVKAAASDGAKIAAADEAKSPAADEAKSAASDGARVAAADEVKAAASDGAKVAAADDAKATNAEGSAARVTGTAASDEPHSDEAESNTPGTPVPATDDATADAGKATVTMTKVAAEPASGASSTELKTTPSRGPGVARILAMAAAALLVIALVCGATLSVLAMRSTHERDERRAEYVETARQAIVNLTTIRADTAKQDIDRILSLASGEFKTEFDGRVDPFTSIVQQAKVVSTGEIVEAALESDDDRSGRVLVAAKQSLTNAGQAEPQTRYYRFRVTVSRGESGLTVSDVEFVA